MSLHGRRMHATHTAPNGAIGPDTTFEFTQRGDIVEARYAGGAIKVGSLVGVLAESRLEFRYAQIHQDNSIHGGHSVCEVTRQGDTVRIIERFQWANGDEGLNVIEDL